MKKHSENILKEVEDFFAAPPSAEGKAWEVVNEFYHLVITQMEAQKISKAELANRIGKSRASITQLFKKSSGLLSETPNITVKRMAEIAHAIDLEIHISPFKVIGAKQKDDFSQISSYILEDIKQIEFSEPFIIVRNINQDIITTLKSENHFTGSMEEQNHPENDEKRTVA